MTSKENKLDKKEKEKTFKPKKNYQSSTRDLLSYIKKTLSQNKAVDITEIQVDQNFSEFEKMNNSKNRNIETFRKLKKLDNI